MRTLLSALLLASLTLTASYPALGQEDKDVPKEKDPVAKGLKEADKDDKTKEAEVKLVWAKPKKGATSLVTVRGVDVEPTFVVTDGVKLAPITLRGWSNVSTALDISDVWWFRLSGPVEGRQIVTSQIGMKYLGAYTTASGTLAVCYHASAGAGLQLQHIPGSVVHTSRGSFNIGTYWDLRIDDLPWGTIVVEVPADYAGWRRP